MDEKREIEVLDRKWLVLRMMRGMRERRTHDYLWHDIGSLFGALNLEVRCRS